VGVLFLLTPIVAFPQSVSVTNPIELAKKTVTPVVCLVRDASTGLQLIRFRILGTGFMVDQTGTFITANHVITEMLNPPLKDACKSAISFPVGGWKRDPHTDVKWFFFDPGTCQINNPSDVAVCRTAEDLSREQEISFDVATISKERAQDGTAIFFTGFPLQATDPITSMGSVAGYPVEESYSTVVIDKNAWPGASGSPIYLSDGKTLIGMITRTGSGDAAGLSFGIGGEKISAILANARSHWEEQKKKKGETLSPPVTQH
jgi:hypothetical protein